MLNNDKSLISSILSKQDNKRKVSEQDVFDLWCPIFKHLISINSFIRLKKGETVNPSSTEQKKLLYPGEQSVIGFKIDFRILYDYYGNEIDLAAGEVAINSLDEDKVVHDETKLLREAKDITDRHICSHLNKNYGWSVQICGLEGSIQTVHLDRIGFYVSVPQFEFVFPKDMFELSKFNDTLLALDSLIVGLSVQLRRQSTFTNFF